MISWFQRLLASCLILATVACVSANAAVVLQMATFGGHTYQLVGGNTSGAGINWTDSEAFAVSLGGHLVTIETAAEDQFLYNTFGNVQFGSYPKVNTLYIGLYETNPNFAGTWAWISGAPVTYTNWYLGEPSNTNGQEHWGSIAATSAWPSPGTWNDVPNWANNGPEPFYGIVEIASTAIPEPTTIIIWSLLGGLGIALGFWRRKRAA